MGKPQQPESNLGMERCLQPPRGNKIEEGALGKGPVSHHPKKNCAWRHISQGFFNRPKDVTPPTSWPRLPNQQMLQWGLLLLLTL